MTVAALPPPRPLRIWPTVTLLAVAFALVLLAIGEAQRTLVEVTALTAERAQARTGRLHLEQALSLFKDMETGARGFALTGEDRFLDPYREAKAALPSARARLVQTIDGALPAGMSWPALDVAMQARFDLLEQLIAGRRAQGAAVAADAALLDAGKGAMDRLRENFAAIDALQAQRILRLEQRVVAARAQAGTRAALAVGLALALIVAALGLLWRERRLRLALEARLCATNAALDAQVAERTAALAEAHDRLARFAVGQERAVEAERRRLAREVHDQIGQIFSAIQVLLAAAPPQALPPVQRQALAQALDAGIETTRRITAELRPPLLDDLGLAAALTHLAEAFSRRSGVACRVALDGAERLDADRALALYRIAQAALGNVERHAAARQVLVEGRPAGADFWLTIVDDGRGLGDAPPRPDALGLAGMKERAGLLGGSCRIFSPPPGGTIVEVSLPLLPPNSPSDDENPAR